MGNSTKRNTNNFSPSPRLQFQRVNQICGSVVGLYQRVESRFGKRIALASAAVGVAASVTTLGVVGMGVVGKMGVAIQQWDRYEMPVTISYYDMIGADHELRSSSREPACPHEFAAVFAESGQFAIALRELDRPCDSDKISESTHHALVFETALAAGELPIAARAAEELLRLSPEAPEAHMRYARVLSLSGQSEDAIDAAIKFVGFVEREYDGHTAWEAIARRTLGESYLVSRRFSEAETHILYAYNYAEDIGRFFDVHEYIETLTLRRQVLSETGRHPQAILVQQAIHEVVTDYFAIGSDTWSLSVHGLAACLNRVGRSAESRDLLEPIVDNAGLFNSLAEHEQERIRENLLYSYLELADFQGAERILEMQLASQASVLANGEPNPLYFKALLQDVAVWRDAGDYVRAAGSADRAVRYSWQLEQEYPILVRMGHLLAAGVYLKADRPHDAIDLTLPIYSGLIPSNSVGRYEMMAFAIHGNGLLQTKQVAGAKEALSRAIEYAEVLRMPFVEYVSVMIDLAEAYRGFGDVVRAKEIVGRASDMLDQIPESDRDPEWESRIQNLAE